MRVKARDRLLRININSVAVLIVILLLSAAVLTSCTSDNKDNKEIVTESSDKDSKEVITYSLYPYLLNSDYYREIIEEEWSRQEPDIKLEFVDYDCYVDGAPEGIDVIMYDAMLLDEFVEAGYLQEIDESDIDDIEDFFDYTLNDVSIDGRLYGIPGILCSEYLIYDKENAVAANAKCVEDMESDKDNFFFNVRCNFDFIYNDYIADSTGTYDPNNQPNETDDKVLEYLMNFGNKDYYDNTTYELAEFYRDGKCSAFMGFSETLSMLGDRLGQTAFKSVSLSNDENTPIYYLDMVGMSFDVDDSKKEECLKLMNIISSTEVMTQATVKDGTPSYLIFPRESVYTDIINEYPLYKTLYEYVSNPDNRICR